MNLQRSLFVIVLFLFVITCKKPVESVPASLSINPPTKEVDANQNSFSIAVTSTTTWSASSDKSWIAISPMSGEGNGTIRVDYQANNSSSKRTSNVLIKGNGVEDKTVTINQLGIVPAFSISPLSQNVTSVGGSTTYTIICNTNWTAASDQPWCTLSPTSGTGDVKLNVNYTANTSTSNRQATITFSIDGLTSKTVTLIQSSLVPSLSVFVQNQSVNSSAGSTSFGITSNIPWTATSNQAWCTFNGNSGSGNGTLSVNYSSNTLSTPRTATITISGTGVANQVVSVTQSGMLAITTSAITNITSSTASSGGVISSDGGIAITARGICWSTGQNPVYTDSHSDDGSGIGTFTSNITGLSASTTYHVRAYAVNAAGTSYGNEVTFTTAGAIVPNITTIAISSITATTATSGGNITSDGGANITTRGVCLSTNINPTVSLNTKTVDGSGLGSFVSTISGLSANTTYHVRAYATNSVGTSYGADQTFTSAPLVASVTTTAVSAITTTTATCGGYVTSDGGATVLSRGVCWSTGQNPTVSLSTKTSDGIGIGSFTSNITGLTANTLYYVLAYATNGAGTSYGIQTSFTTNQVSNLPIVTTTAISSITLSSAVGGGNVTNQGGSAVTLRGVCWSTNINPTISNTYITNGSGTGIFSSNLISLTPNTTYYLKSFATNSYGTSYGNEVSFTTNGIGTPILISPINSAKVSSSPWFPTWSCISGATSYDFQFSNTSTFTGTVKNFVADSATAWFIPSGVNQCNFVINCYNNEILGGIYYGMLGLTDGTYYWRVRTVVGSVTGPWSTAASFIYKF